MALCKQNAYATRLLEALQAMTWGTFELFEACAEWLEACAQLLENYANDLRLGDENFSVKVYI